LVSKIFAAWFQFFAAAAFSRNVQDAAPPRAAPKEL
jgi:hypothetical protein